MRARKKRHTELYSKSTKNNSPRHPTGTTHFAYVLILKGARNTCMGALLAYRPAYHMPTTFQLLPFTSSCPFHPQRLQQALDSMACPHMGYPTLDSLFTFSIREREREKPKEQTAQCPPFIPPSRSLMSYDKFINYQSNRFHPSKASADPLIFTFHRTSFSLLVTEVIIERPELHEQSGRILALLPVGDLYRT